jgi:hypothetical protein
LTKVEYDKRYDAE